MKHLIVGLAIALGLGFSLGDNPTPKPTSVIEFGISKHAGLHYVNGGFNKFKVVKGEKSIAGYKDLRVEVDINSLWTWQSDGSKVDDILRTHALLSEDWFYGEKYPKAYASFNFLPLNDAKKVNFTLKIKKISKVITAEVKGGYLNFKIVLGDFNIDATWKRIFVGKFADVKIKLTREI